LAFAIHTTHSKIQYASVIIYLDNADGKYVRVSTAILIDQQSSSDVSLRRVLYSTALQKLEPPSEA